MDQALVLQQITDLPLTFQRAGAPFTQLVDSIVALLSRDTLSADSTSAMLTFPNARYGWLDVWGLLFGVPRLSNEADSRYSARIVYTVTAGGGPPAAIIAWFLFVWGVLATVSENLPQGSGYWPLLLGTEGGSYIGTETGVLIAINLGGNASTGRVGYTITLPPTLTLAQVQQMINSLARVRPAGVPFQVIQDVGGSWLDTVNYLNAPRVTGAFIGGAGAVTNVIIGGGTNNSEPILPDIYLTDPTLNPT